MQAPLERIPRIDRLLEAAGELVAQFGRAATVEALRAAVQDARERLLRDGGEAPKVAELVVAANRDLVARRPGPPRPVINAAGVVVHTNLGRAPLSAAALE